MIPTNTIVLDLETAHSADDCRHCGTARDMHTQDGACNATLTQFMPIGWDNKPALGLSIGCYWDYEDSRIHWFDSLTVEQTIRQFVARQPLLISFNGIGFDFVLMRGLLRRQAETWAAEEWMERHLEAPELIALCDTFKLHCAASYDLLAEIWKADPMRKFEPGLNSLGAIAEANGLGPKLSHDAQAPRDWVQLRYAEVLNYCQDDVYKTKRLFELVVLRGGLLRGDDLWLKLPAPLAISMQEEE